MQMEAAINHLVDRHLPALYPYLSPGVYFHRALGPLLGAGRGEAGEPQGAAVAKPEHRQRPSAGRPEADPRKGGKILKAMQTPVLLQKKQALLNLRAPGSACADAVTSRTTASWMRR